jgi:hypothetical protein
MAADFFVLIITSTGRPVTRFLRRTGVQASRAFLT